MNYLDPIINLLPKLPSIGWTLIVGYIVVFGLKIVIKQALRVFKIPQAAREVLGDVAVVILWVLFFVALLQSAGLEHLAIALSGSVAIIGIALSTGAGPFVQDVIAGLYLAHDRDFGVGYKVKIGDFCGTIKKVDVRKVRIEGPRGDIYVVPNSEFDKKGWTVIQK